VSTPSTRHPCLGAASKPCISPTEATCLFYGVDCWETYENNNQQLCNTCLFESDCKWS